LMMLSDDSLSCERAVNEKVARRMITVPALRIRENVICGISVGILRVICQTSP